MNPVISESREWGKVVNELSDEVLKLQSYDHTLLSLAGNVTGKNVLDYGSGPGVLAKSLQDRGAKVFGYDICPEMREKFARTISPDNVYNSVREIPVNSWDIIVCNLVVCINNKQEVKNISRIISKFLNPNGVAYIGFCNPHIYDVRDSNLDLREAPSAPYHHNHSYQKTKKEGNYKIIEQHRPLGWYDQTFHDARLSPEGIYFTPAYQKDGRNIRDFVIFKLEHLNKQ